MTGEHVHSPLAFQRPQLSAAAQNPADREAAALRRLHDVVVGISGQDDLGRTLQAVSEGACAMGFGVAVVNLARRDGDLEVVAVAGDDGARAELVGRVRPRHVWDSLLALGGDQGGDGVVFLDHRHVVWPEEEVLASWIPDGEDDAAGLDEDAFHPDDALFVTMHDRDGDLVGTLSVDLPEDGRRPSAATRELLGMFGAHAALAIEHARLLSELHEERLEQRLLVRRLEALLGLSRQLAATSDTDRVVEVVARALVGVVGCDQGAVLLGRAQEGVLRTAAAVGFDDDDARREALLAAELDAASCPEVAQVMSSRAPLVFEVEHVSPVLRELLQGLDVPAVIVAPIVAADDVLGIVTANWRGLSVPAVGRADITARVQGLADQAAGALRNAALAEEVRHQSLHDDLTALPNRRLLSARLEDLLADRRGRAGAAVLFCDLDGFKPVNDRLGHAVGDELLRQAAARLRAAVRAGDTVGRLGGDEFAAVLPVARDAEGAVAGDAEGAVAGDEDPADAQEVARRISAALSAPFTVHGHLVQVSASVGVAVHRGPGGDADALLAQADAAMYEVKRSRRAGGAALSG